MYLLFCGGVEECNGSVWSKPLSPKQISPKEDKQRDYDFWVLVFFPQDLPLHIMTLPYNLKCLEATVVVIWQSINKIEWKRAHVRMHA